MNEKYLEIIKKQQELINLLLNLDSNEIKDIPIETPNENNAEVEVKQGFEKDGFINFLNSKGVSENTVSSYVDRVKRYFAKYDVLSVQYLEEFEQEIHQTMKPKSINLTIAAFTKYFKFVDYQDYEFKRVKEQKKTFCDTAINEEQYNQFVDYLFKNNQIMMWKAVLTMGNTGVRVSELITLKTADLDNGYADITGKGNKTRRIYFPETLVKKIKPYCDGEYIVENRYKQPITTRGVAQQLKNLGVKAGIPKEVVHPHSFRHYFAKQFLKHKNDITLLGDLLGHSDISTTAIYTRMTSEEQQKQINNIVNW